MLSYIVRIVVRLGFAIAGIFAIMWGGFCLFMGGPDGAVGSGQAIFWGSGFTLLGASLFSLAILGEQIFNKLKSQG